MDLFDSPVICEYLDNQHKGRRLLPRKGRDRWVALRQQAMADGLLDAAIPTRVEHVPPDASFDFAMIRRQKISARHLFGAGKKCNAQESISDLRRDAFRKLARRLILATKRFWPKWLRSGNGSLRRQRAEKVNGRTFEVPR